MDKETFTLKQVGQKLGVPVYTVRRLCNAGLVRGIRRNRNGYRVLSGEQVELLSVFVRLMRAGFSREEMRKYAKLQRSGDGTIQERKGMLETQKRQLWLQLQELQQGIDSIERMIEVLDGGILEKH